ncbi:MAG TPA: GNAT family N-acetyltransferase [Clostridia bacterium]|nr:GNAT family N-acetyltransferase [Clostridia bacterium]
MIVTRTCTDRDKSDMKNLWRELFRDSISFTDWFFENRFYPEYCACTYDDELLVSCAHSVPMPLLIRAKEIPSAMISGVATIEAYRKKGLMHKTFRYLVNELNSKGFSAATLKAVSRPVYYSLNYYECTKSTYIHSCKDEEYLFPADWEDYDRNGINKNIVCKKIDIINESDNLHSCYNSFIKNYSAVAIRDNNAFKLKMNDYLSDDAKAIAVFRNGSISGYCIYFDEEEIQAEEYIASDKASACLLFKKLKEERKNITLKTSQRVAEWLESRDTETEEQNSMGIINVSELLKVICNNSDYRIKVTDSFYKENNGIYLFNGQKSEGKCHLEMPSGQLMQLLTGFRSLEELASSGNAVIHDKTACDEIARMLPKQNCFIVDEY